jgi:hypothetical protein
VPDKAAARAAIVTLTLKADAKERIRECMAGS